MSKEFEIELHQPVPGGADIPADGFGWPVWPLTFWSPNGQGNAAKVKLMGRGQDEHIYLADEQMRLGFLLTPDQARQWALSLNAAADLVDAGWFRKWRRSSTRG